jgi:hypothetical protein
MTFLMTDREQSGAPCISAIINPKVGFAHNPINIAYAWEQG